MTNSPKLHLDDQDLHFSVLKEELDVQKRTKVTGIVRLEKIVSTTEAIVEEELTKETISVEHVPINRYIDKAASIRYEGDTTIIPIVEEILIVTKQLVLKEEIRITRLREQSHYRQIVPLRAEEVVVQRLEPK